MSTLFATRSHIHIGQASIPTMSTTLYSNRCLFDSLKFSCKESNKKIVNIFVYRSIGGLFRAKWHELLSLELMA